VVSVNRNEPILPRSNKEIVTELMDAIFLSNNPLQAMAAISERCVDHSPITNANAVAARKVLQSLPPGTSYTPGAVVGEGDVVMVHGRYYCEGQPVVSVIDTFRLANGKIFEHWVVLQDEVVPDDVLDRRAG